MSKHKSMHGAGLAVTLDGVSFESTGAGDRTPSARRNVFTPEDLPAVSIGRAGTLSLYLADALDAVLDIWRDFQKTALYTPFQDVDWVSAWYQASGARTGQRPLVVLGLEDDDLKVIWPLSIIRASGLDTVCWLAQTVNDYNAPLIDPDFAARYDSDLVAEAWALILDACGPVDLVDFSQQPETIAGQSNPFIGQDAMASSCNAHLVNLRPGWRDFYAGLRGSKSRKRLREKENKLARIGRLQFRCEKEPAARRALINQAIAWKSLQLEASGDRNPFASDANGGQDVSEIERTLLAFCDAPGAQHKLRVDSLYVAGKPVAVIIALITGARYSVFITAHGADETQKFSPGTILLVKAMQLACRAGYRQFDLLAGDEAYKMDWCDGHITLCDDLRGLSFKGKAAAPLFRLARHAKKALKQNPRALDIVKRVNKLRSRG